MILKQFYLGCLSHASYMVVDERTNVAAIIDPQRDVEQYLEETAKLGATIEYVLLTHFHADFIAGHLELRDRVGARIFLGARADAEYDFTPLKDGEVVEFGDVRLRVLETPGHTPEGISIVVYDSATSADQPVAVFTGDTLFVGDVGRPDLMASLGVTAGELAGWLYDSLHKKLLSLPDETTVYPAHGAGSLCGKNLSTETFSTIGEQRKFNYALQPMSKEQFIALVTANQPKPPDYFAYDAQMNQRERVTLDANLAKVLKPLSVAELLSLKDQGAQLIDVREAPDFAGAHIEGSINIGLGGKFASWAGTVLDRERPIAVIAEPGTEYQAVTRLGRIGLDQVVGYLEGGMAAMLERGALIAKTDRITTSSLAERLTGGSPPQVLDVRTETEWNGGAIQDSVNIPLSELSDRIEELDRSQEFAVVCASGYRSSLAASMLQRAGFTQLRDTIGGMGAWTANKLPVTTSETSCPATG